MAREFSLPPFSRPERPLAEIDALLARADRRRGDQFAAIERLAAAGQDTAAARVTLGVIEEHLAMLRLTRRYLLEGEPPAGPERDSSVPVLP